MKQIKTNQRTFGKQTRLLVKQLIPTAAKVMKLGNSYIIKDKDSKTVATWHKANSNDKNTNGLIVIH